MHSGVVSAALGIAWEQWTVLGVAGTATPPGHAVDLEALILLTPSLREQDPRLHDEALDWCVLHSQRLVSIARLRRLRAALSDEARHAFDDFAACLNATAKPRTSWPTSHAGTKARTSGKSRPPELAHPALLQLRLRCLFGVTARADVVLQFLRPNMVREVSPNATLTVSSFTDLGYSKPAIADVLTDLTLAGLLEKWRRGNRDYYELTHVAALQELLGRVLPTAAPNWAVRFRVLASLISAEAKTREKKPVVQTVAIIKQLEQYRDVLERMAVRLPSRVYDWSELATWTSQILLLGSREYPATQSKSSRWRNVLTNKAS
jgi:hypothetical protein